MIVVLVQLATFVRFTRWSPYNVRLVRFKMLQVKESVTFVVWVITVQTQSPVLNATREHFKIRLVTKNAWNVQPHTFDAVF